MVIFLTASCVPNIQAVYMNLVCVIETLFVLLRNPFYCRSRAGRFCPTLQQSHTSHCIRTTSPTETVIHMQNHS